ncbi:MAG TPA: hypothetical protein VFT16_00260 [Candidatus Saccharimonadales bacterium]|nr:hypothetical protein [Candidatus Saccharimonadales bacterium]
MKLRHILPVVVITALLAVGLLLPARPVSASTDQDKQIAGVGETIDGLWGYAEENAELPSETFYPEFAKRADAARQKVHEVYEYLGTTTNESDTVAEAMMTIRDDVGFIRDQLSVLRQAAIAKDEYEFEVANSDLEQLVNLYNSDIDAYTAAKYGGRTINDIAGYAGIPALLFAFTCGIFAWALYTNKEEADPLREVIRQLRWRIAYSTAGLLVAVLIPSGVYFSSDSEPLVWLWLPALAALGVLLFHAAMFAKVRVLSRRYGQS